MSHILVKTITCCVIFLLLVLSLVSKLSFARPPFPTRSHRVTPRPARATHPPVLLPSGLASEARLRGHFATRCLPAHYRPAWRRTRSPWPRLQSIALPCTAVCECYRKPVQGGVPGRFHNLGNVAHCHRPWQPVPITSSLSLLNPCTKSALTSTKVLMEGLLPVGRQPNKPMVVVSSVNIDRAGTLCLAAS